MNDTNLPFIPDYAEDVGELSFSLFEPEDGEPQIYTFRVLYIPNIKTYMIYFIFNNGDILISRSSDKSQLQPIMEMKYIRYREEGTCDWKKSDFDLDQ